MLGDGEVQLDRDHGRVGRVGGLGGLGGGIDHWLGADGVGDQDLDPATGGHAVTVGQHGDRAHARIKRKLAGGEFIQRALVLEEDDLAVRLAAGLEADADLRSSPPLPMYRPRS